MHKYAALCDAGRGGRRRRRRLKISGLLMIGMVLVTHGQLATGFRAALEHVVGPQQQFETIAIGPEDDMEQRRGDILNAVSRALGHPVSIVSSVGRRAWL